MKRVLIVAAHTDDEALGCGGTIARHVAEGDIVYAVFLADGVSSRLDSNHEDHEVRNSAAENAREILGISKNYYLALPDNRLDSLPLIEVVQLLEPIIQNVKPNVIYTHHSGDLNVDHRVAHQAVLTACRPLPGSCVKEIYAFEVLSSTEWADAEVAPFVPNYFVDVSDYLDIKERSLHAYKKEMRACPHSRNMGHVRALATHRGNSVGVDAAEAFRVVRVSR